MAYNENEEPNKMNALEQLAMIENDVWAQLSFTRIYNLALSHDTAPDLLGAIFTYRERYTVHLFDAYSVQVAMARNPSIPESAMAEYLNSVLGTAYSTRDDLVIRKLVSNDSFPAYLHGLAENAYGGHLYR